MNAYDALVIGAGPAGSTAARLLARAGWSVALFEKTRFPRRKVCGEFISGATLPLLDALGAGAFFRQAGPEIRSAGIFCGTTAITADMPAIASCASAYGRALGREHLDELLLRGAAEAGAQVWQPWALLNIEKTRNGFVGATVGACKHERREICARVVVAAHGSWEHGMLPTQIPRDRQRTSDLLAFKAHFRNCDLPPALMPLIAFPGGYGGMVRSDDGRTSLSCCIRRDELAQCRRKFRGVSAGEAVLAHIRASCAGVDAALAGAQRDGGWLAAGPIRPGIRPVRNDGIFLVGNAAGEAHPIVAEGISMAIQSAWLLCERLIGNRDGVFAGRAAAAVARDYEAAWRKNFSTRIHCAALFAHLAMRPVAAHIVARLLEHTPRLLSIGALLSGKASHLSKFECGARARIGE